MTLDAYRATRKPLNKSNTQRNKSLDISHILLDFVSNIRREVSHLTASRF